METVQSQFDRMPPHDIDSELCVLASMMIAPKDSGIISQVKGIIAGEDFYQADNQIIFEVLVEMDAKEMAIDAVLLSAELESRTLLQEIGGRDYLRKILNTVPSYAHAEHYAKNVKETSLWRQVIAKSNDILRAAYSPRKIGEAAAEISSYSAVFSEIAVKGCSNKIQHIGDVMAAVVSPSDDEDGIATGITDLDDLIGLLPFGQFAVVGGRPGMGKSQLVKQTILNIASAGTPAGLVSIEEGGRKIAQNLLANLSGVENHRIAFRRTGTMERGALQDALSVGSALPIFYDESSTRISEIESTITRMVLKHRCKFIAVDFLQLIDAETQGDNENRELTLISNTLKRIFKRLKVASMVAAQLNRGGDNREVRKPTLKDLRGSGTIEQNADIVILLHREDYYRQHDEGFTPDHQLQAIIAKHKNNAQAVVPLYFSGKFQRITNWNGGLGVDPNAPKGTSVFEPHEKAHSTYDDHF